MLILQCGLLLVLLKFVRTAESVYDYGLENSFTEYERRFSYWPSVHNGLLRLHKRNAAQIAQVAQDQGNAGPSEGGDAKPSSVKVEITTPLAPADVINHQKMENPDSNKVSVPKTVSTGNHTADDTDKNVNTTAKAPAQTNLSNPGALKRGVIVFGGFLMLGVAYFVFYRKKGNKNDVSNTHHNTNDANQFRYGVLQSEDRRDNLELSQIPLTMESDEEDDEDLEIFDLEQKKKSLSYINLQTNDEDIVFNNLKEDDSGNDKDNLLLDIEDAASDTLINWSNNGNKSIL